RHSLRSAAAPAAPETRSARRGSCAGSADGHRPHRQTADRDPRDGRLGRGYGIGFPTPPGFLQAERHDHRTELDFVEGGPHPAIRRTHDAPLWSEAVDVRKRLACVYAGWDLEGSPGRLHAGSRPPSDGSAGANPGWDRGAVLSPAAPRCLGTVARLAVRLGLLPQRSLNGSIQFGGFRSHRGIEFLDYFAVLTHQEFREIPLHLAFGAREVLVERCLVRPFDRDFRKHRKRDTV